MHRAYIAFSHGAPPLRSTPRTGALSPRNAPHDRSKAIQMTDERAAESRGDAQDAQDAQGAQELEVVWPGAGEERRARLADALGPRVSVVEALADGACANERAAEAPAGGRSGAAPPLRAGAARQGSASRHTGGLRRWWVAGRPEAAVLDTTPGLQGLIVPFSGVPEKTRALLRERPHLRLYNLHHNAAVVAESALALALAAARGLMPAHEALRRGDWRPRYGDDGSRLLAGGRALLYGYGAIGRALAPMLRGLGMEVHALRRTLREERQEHGVRMRPADALEEELPEADLVVLCAPSTPETRGRFDRETLQRCRRGAVLVNVGRGDLIVEEALFEALRDGPLHSAALDVWWNYPAEKSARASTPASVAPLHTLENLVWSPHRSGHFADIERRRVDALAELLRQLQSDDPPEPINPERGY